MDVMTSMQSPPLLDREYWKARLAGLEELVLPTDGARPPASTGQVVRRAVGVSPEVTERLERPGYSLASACHAACAMLMARYADRDDVLIGVAQGRDVLPVRVDLSNEPSFLACVEHVHARWHEAQQHGVPSLEMLDDLLQVVPEPGRPPLVQVVCAVIDDAAAPPVPDSSRHDLVVTFTRDATARDGGAKAGLTCEVVASADLFSEARVDAMAEHLVTLLEAATREPEARLWDLPVMGARELEQVVHGWNSFVDLLEDDDAPIHEVFEARAAQFPQRVAITCGDRSLTYDELNRWANQVAHTLQRQSERTYGRDVQPDDLIGLCVERDVEMMVGILGILKAGAAYVPLDPRYPEDRLRFMAEDAQCRFIVTQQSCLEQMLFFAEGDFGVISLDGGHRLIAQAPTDNLPRRATSANLAYVIYTSGSTGRPKGVLIEHRNVRRLMKACDRHYDLSERDVWTCFHSYAFDFSVWEIWGALLHGARLVVVPYAVSRDPEQFHALLCDEGVTVLSQTPSAFYQLMQADQRATRRIPALRYVVYGGEALELRRLSSWHERYPAQAPQLVNMYGITETTVHSTFVAITPQDVASGRTWSPIGRPLCDLTFYVLDRHLRPVPVGIPGELYMGGAGLARGYFCRPELNAARFIPNPCASRLPDPRLYKTGDVVRWAPDGTLEYVGRNDFQVKIRGFRIELPEIEAQLERHPDVAQAVVVALPGEGGPVLVAYHVSREGRPVLASALRAWLRETLPDYMVPQAFVPLAAMPLGATGKTDRKALPAPGREHFAGDSAFVAPRTPTEEAIAAIFRDVLKAEQVGVHDDFFLAGGHSLMATQAVSRVRETFGVRLSLHALFEHRTVERLAALVGEQGAQAPAGEEAIPSLPRDQELPLSFAQSRLWFIDHYEGGRGHHYNVPMAIRLRGALDVEALERALGWILARHEILRTSYPQRDGVPRQQIAPWMPFRLQREPVVVEGVTDRGDPEALLEAFLTMEAHSSFDLEAEAPARVVLFEMPADENVLMVNLHHILTDGWSVGVFLRELGVLYGYAREHRATAADVCPVLPPLPVQYADFACWQRRRMEEGAFASQVDYWRAKLAGLPQLDLPTDHARPPVRTFHGARTPCHLDAGLLADLEGLARSHEATLFMVLVAALSTLMGRYSGQDDVVIGTPIANRHRREVEPLLGFFVNTLPLRCSLDGRPSFVEVLARARTTCLEAYDNQDVPFEHLVETLHVPRDPSRTPIVNVLLNFQNATDGDDEGNLRVFNDRVRLDMAGLEVTDTPFRYCQAQFDLALTLDATSCGLSGSLEYATDLFDEATARRMVGHLETLLRAIVRNPGHPVDTLPLLGDRERHALVARNATTRPYRDDTTIHALFVEQALRTPHAVAVRCEDQALTYAELHAKALRTAQALLRLGAGAGTPVAPDTLVGLCLDRHVDRVTGILGILMAGAAYVPIDPGYPPDRVQYLLEDAGIRLVVTESTLLERFPALGTQGRRALQMDGEAEAPVDGVKAAPAPAGPGNLAYVIYTSGSTGRPKGVGVEHRNACHLAQYLADDLGLEPGTRLAQLASVCFDISVMEWIGALTTGAELYVFSPREMPPHADVGAVLAKRGVTHVVTTPALLESMERRELPTLRFAMSGGEVLPPHLVSRLAPGRRFMNAYGPTEITVLCTAIDCHAGLPPTLGRPIHNTQIWILDPQGQPVPDGVPGELYVGGCGVARGYLGRPELTAERFVMAPAGLVSSLGVDPESRLYRTGDLGRWTPEGTIEYLGRLDLQVKMRGFRIELGEIETELNRHAAVRECAVIVRDHHGDKSLAACWVPSCMPAEARAGAEPRALDWPGMAQIRRDLEAHLALTLPAYMIPADFVAVGMLPVTSNGKVDRKTLERVVAEATLREEAGEEQVFVSPRTPTEEALVEVFREVLGVERVSTHQGFFELGGHSLNALRLVFRIEKQFAVPLPVRALFEHPRVDDLARHLDTLRERASGVDEIPRVERTGLLPASLAQERLWFMDRLEAACAATYNMPVAFRLQGPLDVDALRQALQVVVARHESLRMRFPEMDGTPRMEIMESLPLAVLVEPMEPEALGELLAKEALTPFDLATGPLVRARLFSLSSRLHVLLLVLHHIIGDGWSLHVLTRELGEIYEALRNHRPANLPPLTVDYADFAQWQRQRLSGTMLDELCAGWKKRMEGFTDLEFPCDHPRPPEQTFRGTHHHFRVDPETWRWAEVVARGAGATPYMLVLATFAMLLGRYSDQEDIVLGTPAAGRSHRDLQDMVGFFVNTQALRVDLAGNPTFSELLARVGELCRAAQAHQELPFERLVQAMGIRRDPSRTPIFQVMLVFQEAMSLAGLAMPGVRVDEVPFAFDVAKFDLAFNVGEREGTLQGEIEYNTDLFDPERIVRMATHFETLLASAVAHADAPISTLAMLTPPELEEALGCAQASLRAAGDGAPATSPGTIHGLFDAQATRVADRTALAWDGGSLTYAELRDKVHALARVLRTTYQESQGEAMPPEAVVALCARRGCDWMVAMLAILEAGGTMLPVDPASPQERIHFMLQDSGARLAVTHGDILDSLPVLGSEGRGAVTLDRNPGARSVTLDGQPGVAPEAAPLPVVAPEQLAALIYTSGSTGRPKGVMVEHRNLVNFIEDHVARFGITEESRVLQNMSTSFDASWSEIGTALAAGATLVLGPKANEVTPDAFFDFMARHRVTYAVFPAAVLEELPRKPGLSVEVLEVGGDVCRSDVLAFWCEQARVMNSYGPTETAVTVSTAVVRPGGPPANIGHPIRNARALVLDSHLRPVPVGVPGELHVGGAGVTRGYLGREDLTRERFIPDPTWSGDPQACPRLYRTGDMVRRNGDGSLTFCGRRDFQVKIRGFRIELGEVEEALRAHPAVEACAAGVRLLKGEKRLIAWIEPRAGVPLPGDDELRTFLAETLIDAMVPSFFVPMERLPLNLHGKLDRQALPDPAETSATGQAALVAPRTDEERQLAALWQDVLQRAEVGVTTDFFSLGGHSMLATRLVARINATFGIDLPVGAIFAYPTVETLAAHVQAVLWATRGATGVPATDETEAFEEGEL